MKRRQWIIASAALLVTASLAAQPASDARRSPVPRATADSAHIAAEAGFKELSAWITKAADMVPADKYTYRPTQTVRTFGQLVAHVVDGYNYYCGRAAGKAVQWSDAAEKGATDKATVTAKLKQGTATCTSTYGAGNIGQLIANIGHGSLHYGNLITYVRMMGMVPPSS